MFDEENIVIRLRDAGFNQVDIRDFDDTQDNIERRHQSIYVKAVKVFLPPGRGK